MKKSITILLLFSLAFATPKNKLKDCEIALQLCLQSPNLQRDTIYLHVPKTSRKDVKIAKYQAKTERKESTNEKHQIIAELKTIKAIELSEDKVELKTSAVYQLGSSFKALLRGLNISQALGLGGGVLGGLMGLFGFAEKFKPITKVLSLFKKD